MFEKSLYDLIKGLRNHRGTEDDYIRDSLRECKAEVKSQDMDKKATALLKVIYLEMFGYDMSWASFHVLEVMSSARYLQKRVGYLGAVQSFKPDTEVLMLATNLLKKDLTSSSIPGMSLPVTALPHIITPSLAISLLPDILSRLSHSRAVVRKKAIVCLYRLALIYPEALKLAWPKLKERLMDDEEECSVTTAVINVICELGWRRPHDFLPLAPRLFDLLVDGGNNWMAIKIIKVFATLTSLEPRLIRKLTRPLMKIIQTTSAMSLLYECINGIIQGGILDGDEALDDRDEVASLCVGKLRGMVVADSDPNLKYVALLAFNRILFSHPGLVSMHRDVIMDCLEDADISIRIQALELASKLVTYETLQSVVDRLIKQLRDAKLTDLPESRNSSESENLKAQMGPTLPDDYRIGVVHQILDICSFNNYSELPDFEWYVDLLVQLVKLLPRQIGDLHFQRIPSRLSEDGIRNNIMLRIGSELRNIAVRVKGVRIEATRAAEYLILVENRRVFFPDFYGSRHALGPLAWIVGEHSDCLSSPSQTLQSLIDESNMSLPAVTLSLYVQAIPKVLIRVMNDPQHPWSALRRSETSLLLEQVIKFLENLAVHPDLDVQERAIEFLEVMRLAADAVLAENHQPDALPFLLSSIMPNLFCGLELNPVALSAQRKVPLPGHLILNEVYNRRLWGVLGDHLGWLPEVGSQHSIQKFYHIRDTSTTHSLPTESATVGAHPNAMYQHGSNGQPDEVFTTMKRRAERRERNREDPFYIATEDSPSATNPQGHNISPDGGLDIDSIPIINLNLSNFGSPQRAFVKPETRGNIGSRSKKYDVTVDETIGYGESMVLGTDELGKVKQSLLQVDSSGLGRFHLEKGGRLDAAPSDSAVATEDDEEMAKAVQEVERLRLAMQRASERVLAEGIPVEGTPVKRKKRLKKTRTKSRTSRVLQDSQHSQMDSAGEV